MDFSTSACSRHNHPEFEFDCDERLPPGDVQSLIDYLEKSVAGGSKFEPGQTVQFGSVLLLIDRMKNDRLTLLEPDFQGLPVNWTASVTNSVKVLRLQRDVADSVGLLDEISFPDPRASVLDGADVNHQKTEFRLLRDPPTEDDSGWFLGNIKPTVDYNQIENLRRISIYEAMMIPRVGKYLALPPSLDVEEHEFGNVKVSKSGHELPVKRGSLLEALLEGRSS